MERFAIENNVCCGFGHTRVIHSLNLLPLLEELITEKAVTTFMTGGMGEFDHLFIHAIRQLKKQYPFLRLILVKPYFSNELNTHQQQYAHLYDEIIIPEAVEGVHFKAAIEKRNRWIVEHSNFVLSYLYRAYGGAYKAVRYAEKCHRRLFV